MDLLGHFDFGKVIRLFFPGITLLLATILFADACLSLILTRHHILFALIAANQPMCLALSLPAAVICGILLNAILFVTNMSRWMGSSKRRQYSKIIAEIISQTDTTGMAAKLFALLPAAERDNLSLETFLLPVIPPDRLLFLKQHYYYYFCFDIAFGLSLTALEGALLVWMLVYRLSFGVEAHAFWILFATSILAWIALAIILYLAAKKNYRGKVRADLTFYIGTLCLVNSFAYARAGSQPEKVTSLS